MKKNSPVAVKSCVARSAIPKAPRLRRGPVWLGGIGFFLFGVAAAIGARRIDEPDGGKRPEQREDQRHVENRAALQRGEKEQHRDTSAPASSAAIIRSARSGLRQTHSSATPRLQSTPVAMKTIQPVARHIQATPHRTAEERPQVHREPPRSQPPAGQEPQAEPGRRRNRQRAADRALCLGP